MAPAAPNMPFIKNLASSDRKIRTHALDTLKTFLSTKYASAYSAPLTFADAEKLWAGLFYALWMADRPLVQQRLADEIAGIPGTLKLPNASVAAWLRAFWATMARQWNTGIDVLRMDKFMLLVRRVLASQLAWMAGAAGAAGAAIEEGAELTEAQALGLAVLANWPFNVDAEARLDDDGGAGAGSDKDDDSAEDDDMVDIGRDGRVRPAKRARKNTPSKAEPTVHIPVGLAIHAADIWVDEAVKTALFASTVPGSNGKDTLGWRVNGLVEALAAKTTFPAVRARARESLADERLPWNQPADAVGGEGVGGDDDDASSDGSWDGFND